MTNLTQTLLEIRNKFNQQTAEQIKNRDEQRAEQMTALIDEYIYLIDHTTKTLQRAGLIKSRHQFSKIINLPSNFCYDLPTKRTKPQLKDITSIQMYIQNILSDLNHLLDEYANKQVIQSTLNRLSDRYTQLFINAQRIYLS